MANDYRDDRDFGRGNQNRGMLGYEGEGYMRGSHRDRDFGGRWREDRPSDDYRGGYGYGGPRGYSDVESDRARGGFRPNDYGDFNRGDYAYSSGNDWGTQQRQSFRGRGPKNYQRSDERIREDVCERLAIDDDVDATEIEVNVNGSTVVLTGSVQDRFAKRRAEDIAESVMGVKEVQNQIRVTR